MEHWGIFICANSRGVMGWTLMKFDGAIYWHPSNKWYSSYKVANKMADRLNEQIKSNS